MLALNSNARFFFCQYPVSMRKSFNGLSIDVEKLFPKELLSGAFFIFLNRQKDSMKILFWDGDGLIIWYKRLEKGSFSSPDGTKTLDRKTFLMLLEGIVPKRINRRYKS